MQYFDDWNGQFFLHHPFNADSLSEVEMQNRSRRSTGKTRSCPMSTRCMRRIRSPSRECRSPMKGSTAACRIRRSCSPYVDPSTGLVDGITNRTSYLLNSQLSHKTIRYGRWSFPRFQYDIGTSNFVCMNERDGAVMDANINDPVASTDRGRTTTTSGWGPSLSTNGFPGTDTGRRMCCIRWSRQVGAEARRVSGHVSGRGDPDKSELVSIGRRGASLAHSPQRLRLDYRLLQPLDSFRMSP